MKKLLLISALMTSLTIVSGQKSIDNLFDKYAGKDGFTTVTLNGNLLRLGAALDNNDKENDMPADISQIRILTQEDKSLKVENFYNMVIKDIDLSKYEEFMRVKESNQDLRMLVRTEGDRFKEFLFIAGGEDNALIQIKGNMSLDEAKKFSDHAIKDHGEDIAGDQK